MGEKPVKGRVAGLTTLPDGRYALEAAIPRQAGMLAGQPASISLPQPRLRRLQVTLLGGARLARFLGAVGLA